jgi:hypothetical protein
MNDEAENRQRRQDREYLAACKAAGIEPEPAHYRATGTEDEAIDRFAHEDEGIKHNGSAYAVVRDNKPPKPLTPEAEGAARILEIIIPLKSDPALFVQTAGRRCLALAWLLGKRPEPLAELARGLGITRASMSVYARALEDRLGIHGRGQKRSGSRANYATSARKSWKLRKLNTLMTEATATENKTPASGEADGCL